LRELIDHGVSPELSGHRVILGVVLVPGPG
jgi:hypothetical protein